MTFIESASALEDWALGRLKKSVLADARSAARVWLIEDNCWCFTSNGIYSGRSRARTALLKEGTNGPIVYRVEDGWALPPDRMVQGPIKPASEGAT